MCAGSFSFRSGPNSVHRIHLLILIFTCPATCTDDVLAPTELVFADFLDQVWSIRLKNWSQQSTAEQIKHGHIFNMNSMAKCRSSPRVNLKACYRKIPLKTDKSAYASLIHCEIKWIVADVLFLCENNASIFHFKVMKNVAKCVILADWLIW